MALRAGYKGIKKYVADMLNKMNPGDTFATDAEIAAAIESSENEIYGNIGWKGNDLINHTLSYIKAVNTGGEWNDNVYTRSGCTFTVNSDNTITVKGTATAGIHFLFPELNFSYDIYELTGCPAGGSLSGYYLYVGGVTKRDYGNGLVTYVPAGNRSVIIYVANGTAISTPVIFKPILRLATVQERLDKKADISALGTEEGLTASRLYHPGEHFYKDGKFCTVIGTADVASGSTWTLNTNYVEGTVANLMLGNRTLGGSDDLNNITINGIYGFGSTPVNAPNVSNLIHGMLIVCRSYQDTIITQTIIQITNGMFVRRLNSGVWSAWTQFVDLT